MTRTQRISTIAGLISIAGAAMLALGQDSGDAVLVAADGVPCANVSDRNTKENFEPIDPADVLDRVMSMPISTWNYKGQGDSIRHMGPMAQDFWPAFGLGDDALRISTIDADGVALAAIQGLGNRLHDTQRQLDLQVTEVAALRQEITQQEDDGGIAGAVTSFFSISGNAFQASLNSTTWSRGLEGVRGTTSGELVRFFAPIDLPHGAVVTAFEAQVLDNDATQNVSLSLGFITDGGGVGGMATLATTGSAANVRTFSTTTITQGATVDNQNRSYHVSANWTVPTPSFNIRLARVHVTYTLP
jgi:hypothetical protein